MIRGIIPALAGNTRQLHPRTATFSDHPRSRGEYFGRHFNPFLVPGSSPLSRGILFAERPDIVSAGIIPALAGNTVVLQDSEFCIRDHPRSRGEYPFHHVKCKRVIGSSPLSRGILTETSGVVTITRIIPALAGNTFTHLISIHRPRDHPRSRGEYSKIIHSDLPEPGSSPLSRGIHLLTRDFISRTCRILGTPSSHVSASRSHSPRVCDGHPPGGVGRLARHLKDLDGPSRSAPRSRLVPMDHPMSGRTYLARSWHGTP